MRLDEPASGATRRVTAAARRHSVPVGYKDKMLREIAGRRGVTIVPVAHESCDLNQYRQGLDSVFLIMAAIAVGILLDNPLWGAIQVARIEHLSVKGLNSVVNALG